MKKRLSIFFILHFFSIFIGRAYAGLQPAGPMIMFVIAIIAFWVIVSVIIISIIVAIRHKKLKKAGYSQEDIKKKDIRTFLALFVVALLTIYLVIQT